MNLNCIGLGWHKGVAVVSKTGKEADERLKGIQYALAQRNMQEREQCMVIDMTRKAIITYRWSNGVV
jgi:hypothetical protein